VFCPLSLARTINVCGEKKRKKEMKGVGGPEQRRVELRACWFMNGSKEGLNPALARGVVEFVVYVAELACVSTHTARYIDTFYLSGSDWDRCVP